MTRRSKTINLRIKRLMQMSAIATLPMEDLSRCCWFEHGDMGIGAGHQGGMRLGGVGANPEAWISGHQFSLDHEKCV